MDHSCAQRRGMMCTNFFLSFVVFGRFGLFCRVRGIKRGNGEKWVSWAGENPPWYGSWQWRICSMSGWEFDIIWWVIWERGREGVLLVRVCHLLD